MAERKDSSTFHPWNRSQIVTGPRFHLGSQIVTSTIRMYRKYKSLPHQDKSLKPFTVHAVNSIIFMVSLPKISTTFIAILRRPGGCQMVGGWGKQALGYPINCRI